MEAYQTAVINGDLNTLKLLFPNLTETQKYIALEASVNSKHIHIFNYLVLSGVNLEGCPYKNNIWEFMLWNMDTLYDDIKPYIITINHSMIFELLIDLNPDTYAKILPDIDCHGWIIIYSIYKGYAKLHIYHGDNIVGKGRVFLFKPDVIQTCMQIFEQYGGQANIEN